MASQRPEVPQMQDEYRINTVQPVLYQVPRVCKYYLVELASKLIAEQD